jgi:hypothetical protein
MNAMRPRFNLGWVPHPFAFFAKGWETMNRDDSYPTNSIARMVSLRTVSRSTRSVRTS